MGERRNPWIFRGVITAYIAVGLMFAVILSLNVMAISEWTSDELGEGRAWDSTGIISQAMVDSQDTPHVLFTTDDGLAHAMKVDGGWWTTLAYAIEPQAVMMSCCAVIDNEDDIHVFISTRSSPEPDTPTSLTHMEYSGLWRESEVEGVQEVDYHYALACAIGPNGDMHVISSGFKKSAEPGEYIEEVTVLHWRFDGSVWVVSQVLTFPDGCVGALISDMALDSMGRIHAVAQHNCGDGDELAYILYDGSSWQMDLLERVPSGLPCVTIYEDEPLIAFNEEDRVVLLANDGTEWSTLLSIECAPCSNLDMAVASDGTLHIINPFVREDDTGEGLQHVEYRDGILDTTVVSTDSHYFSSPSIAFDADGAPHIGYTTSYVDVVHTSPTTRDSALASSASDAAVKTVIIGGPVLVIVTAVLLHTNQAPKTGRTGRTK